jgi:oligoendopeptidase F
VIENNNCPNWDLGSLYRSVDDPAIEADLDHADALADLFAGRWRGQIVTASAMELSQAIVAYEELQEVGLKPYFYAELLFYADSLSSSHQALLARIRERFSLIGEKLIFFELDILQIETAAFRRLVAQAALRPWSHYLEQLRKSAPYSLSEEVEQALTRKDLTGKEGFVQLFDELTSSFSFSFTRPGEETPSDLSGEELLSYLYHSEDRVREAAFSIFLNKHREHALVLTSCFNNLLLDHEREGDLRGYPEPMTPTHLSSETEPFMVEQMMRVSERNYPLARDYYRLKQQLLGLDRMKNTDLYAPLPGSEQRFSFTEAQSLIMDAFSDFSPQLSDCARLFFSEKRIDAPTAAGKSGGAFCMGMLPGLPPYIMLNFTGNLRDLSTLAHELGHGVHFSLSQGQRLSQYNAPLPLAETASVFGEMLLTRRLLEQGDRQMKIELLCARIEEVIATSFRQNVLTRFELAAHRLRGEKLLSTEDYCELWWRENRKLLGEDIEMIEPYRYGWSYISHFVHSRFYCYSYVFGELLVLSLYRQYQQQGDAFVAKYLELLKAGGSASPQALLEPFGVDLNDPAFWQQGYDLLAEMIEQLKQLLEQG